MTSLDVVKNYYDCFNRQDWNGMLALVHPNIRHEPNQGEARIGIEKFAAFLQHMDESYEETLTDIVFFTEPTGKRVAVEFVVNVLQPATLDSGGFAVKTVSDAFTFFPDEKRAGD
jgi:hypothetical protein